MPKDACYRKIMKSYGKWSARAAQATAKCRKAKGKVKKSKAGSNLKRWGKEKWVDTRTGKPCGSGGKNEYCRPTRRVSSKTPKTRGEMSKDRILLAITLILFLAAAFLVDYIDELKKQKRNGKKSR
jgi:hypothetical protein